jgi:integrase
LPARGSILAWFERRDGTLDEFAFSSRIDHTDHISTRQYARLVEDWVTGIGLRPEGTHSLRRTKASIIYKLTGSLRRHGVVTSYEFLGVSAEELRATIGLAGPRPRAVVPPNLASSNADVLHYGVSRFG